MKTTIHLNNTALTRLYSCERLFQVSCLWGYDEGNEYVEFGKHFHKFVEGYNKEGKFELAKWAISGGMGTPQFLAATAGYSAAYPPKEPLRDKEGNPLIEYTFCYPLLENDTHIIYATGTADCLELDEEGSLVLTDYKTARKADISAVLDEYFDHLQLYWYLYHLKHHLVRFLLPEHASLVESGRFYGRYRGVFLSFNPPKFRDSAPISLSEDIEDDIRRLINYTSARIVTTHNNYQDNLALPTGMSNNSCKNCWMQKLCRMKDHKRIKEVLTMKESTPYDPRNWR